jgi:hypothetical protein
MTSTAVIDKAAPTRTIAYGSISRDRAWALRWSYFFLAVCAVLAGAAALHDHHLAEKQRGNLGGNQSVVGVSSDAVELPRVADLEPVPDLPPQLRAGLDLRGDDHHADQHTCRLRIVANAVLGFGDARHRCLPHLPGSGHVTVPAAVQDVRGVLRLDRHPVDQPMVCAADCVSDADRAVLHLDHDRLFRLDSQGARRGRHRRRRLMAADADPNLHSGGAAGDHRRRHLRVHGILGAVPVSAGVHHLDRSAGAAGRHLHHADQAATSSTGARS